ncbi:MAG: phytanoyl-CoA dioxygenase family protein, partial [Zetaproteobacteria bacterium]|nr:phytanoyl-CoA dioxygenase family protein [Zetaproteobacteria bacterium]
VFSNHIKKHTKDKYFLESGDKVRFFFEEGSFTQEGQLRGSPLKLVNKIGHALHNKEATFRAFAVKNQLQHLATQLGYIKQPRAVQSMVICKQAQVGGEVKPHQDSSFLHTKSGRILGMWIALEDATQDNGCLQGIPGPYAESSPQTHFVREGDTCRFEVPTEANFDLDKMQPLEVGQGSIILFTGLFPHMSYANHSTKSRFAYTIHWIDKTDEFLPSNWLQLPPKNKDIPGASNFNNLFALFTLTNNLKQIKRTGWIHSGIPKPESVSDHSHQLSIMCIILADLIPPSQRDKLLRMAVVHDLAEAIAGDITPFEGITPTEKYAIEDRAMRKILYNYLDNWDISDDIYGLWLEYTNGETQAAQILKQLDKIEMLFQAKEYEHNLGINLDQFFNYSMDKISHPLLSQFADYIHHKRPPQTPSED